MGLNLDKTIQQEGITLPQSTPQPEVETKPVASQPIDFSAAGSNQDVQNTSASQPIDMTSGGRAQEAAEPEPQIYTVKKGDTLWAVAKQQLIDSGIPNPTNKQIMEAMQTIAKANGCKDIDECRYKYFNKIGSELNVAGFSVEHTSAPVQTPKKEEPKLSEEEQKQAEQIKAQCPDLGIENISDAEMKQMLDTLKETKPDIFTQESHDGVAGDFVQAVQEYLTEHPEVLKPSGASVPKSEMEELAEKCGIEGDFDSVIKELKNMQISNPEQLTPVQKELLEKWDASNLSKAPKTEDSDKELADIIVKMVNGNALDKTDKEQFEFITNMFLRNDKEYSKLSGDEKTEYFNKTKASLVQMAEESSAAIAKKVGKKQNTMLAAMVLFGYAKNNNLSIEQLEQMNPNDRIKAVGQAEGKVLKTAMEVVAYSMKNDNQIGSAKAKLDKYVDIMLKFTDSEYRNITDPAEKEKYRENKVKGFAKAFDIDFRLAEDENGNVVDRRLEDRLYKRFAVSLECAINTSVTRKIPIDQAIQQFNKMSKYEKDNVVVNYLESVEPRTEYQERILNHKKVEMSLLENLSDNPSCKDMLDSIDKRLADPNLSKSERIILERMKKSLGEYSVYMGKDPSGLKYEDFEPMTFADKLRMDGLNIKDEAEAINIGLGKFTRENAEEKLKTIAKYKDYIAGAEFHEIYKQCRNAGLSDAEIKQLFRKVGLGRNHMAKMHATAVNAEQTAALVKIGDLNNDTIFVTKNALEYSTIKYTTTEDRAKVQVAAANSACAEFIDSWSRGANKNCTREEVVDITTLAGQSPEMTDAGRAKAYRSIVATAQDDDTRLYYGRELSSRTDNVSALEGLAAASDSFTDSNLRNQYNSHISNAASNLPPDDQARINTAMQTGSISQETLSKTSSSSSSSSSQQSSSQNSSSQQTSQQVSVQGTRSGQQTAQASASQTPAQNYASPQTVQQSAAAERLQQIQAQQQQNAQYLEQQRVEKLQAEEQQRVERQQVEKQQAEAQKQVEESRKAEEKQKIEGQIRQGVEADEAFRQEVMAKAKELAEDIQESVAEWENRHRKLTTEEGELITAGIAIDAAVEAINSSGISSDDKNALIAQISKASSIDEIYEILISRSVNIGSVKEKVLDLLGSSASPESVRNVVAELISDDTVVKELFKRTSSTSIKKELLSMMSTDTVVELLASKQIKNIGDVDHKILRTFLEKNIYSMSNADFNEYLKHLPLDDRMALVELRNNARGNKNQTVPSGENHDADMVTLAQDEESPNRIFSSNETTKTLSDGTTVTTQCTTFGPVSDTDFETYQVVQPDKKDEGAPIGMNDDVLTVTGWNLKYNGNNVQTTAFTMASMDEYDEDDGVGNFMSTKGNFKGKPIKKKYKPGGFSAMG